MGAAGQKLKKEKKGRFKMEFDIQYDKSVPGHAAKKFACPSCNKKRYVRFYDFTEKEYLPEEFGKCDREDTCGYVQTPWEWLKNKQQELPVVRKSVERTKELRSDIRILPVDKDIVIKTLGHYELNNFAIFLSKLLGADNALALLSKYYVGTAKREGTIFWQVDKFMRVRTGQKIHYKLDGHRDKTVVPPSQRLFEVKDGYEPCLFGEHLLFEAPLNAVFALCESEKTAIICSAYYQFWNSRPLYWLASSGMHGANDDKIKVLEGLDIVLVPDFSFAARATWGQVPMRKGKNDKGKLVIKPDGDVVEDYISLKDKLVKLSCKVEFFDPYPNVQDGSDLADFVTDKAAPLVVERPDFDSLVIDNVVDKGINKPIDPTAMIYEKYGYGISEGKFNLLHHSLSGQIKLSQDPRVMQLAKMFDCKPNFDF